METMAFRVNGRGMEARVGPRTTLLQVLRDQMRLTGTKNGCGAGRCGACTVIVAGEAVRSCVYLARRARGQEVQTIEGLAVDGRLHPLQKAFIEHGAVQCGFCTPGMIMAAKALLDKNPRLTRQDIFEALELNLCRCTGYVKIIEAVGAAGREQEGEIRELVAGAEVALRQGQAQSLSLQGPAIIGAPLPRPDARVKVTGEARFAADLHFDSMLFGRVLRSAHPHARVLGVDTARAKALPGVAAVLTAADVPGARNHGLVRPDWPVLAYDKVRYMGDAVALVAAEDEETAAKALGLIRVQYEPLPGVFSPQEALEPGAPQLHEGGNLLKHIRIEKGNLEEGFRAADLVIEREYRTPFVEHAFLEPEAGVAVVDGEGNVTVYVGSQIPFADQRQVAEALGLPLRKVRIVQTPVGGAFGGKEDISVQIHVALLAWHTRRPVKLVLSREESILTHPKRHASIIRLKTGVTKEGRLTALQATIWGDSGAYASLGEHVMTRTATHMAGPYEIANVKVDCYAAYTNNTPAGAMRGFGVPQATFVMESQMDILARELGLDPLDLRRRNALRVGSITATGQVLRESVGLVETIDRVAQELRAERALTAGGSALPPNRRRGWGVACCFKNVGLGGGVPDSAGATVELGGDGSAVVSIGAAEVGQGLVGIAAQIVAQELGLRYDQVRLVIGDTGRTLDGGATTASRQTFVTGNAVRLAARKLRETLALVVGDALRAEPAALKFQNGLVLDPTGASLSLTQVADLAKRRGLLLAASHVYTPPPTVPLGKDGDAHFAYGYATQAALVEVDTGTGEVQVLKVIAAHDVGRAINPLAIEGQLAGGVMMGLGYALMEELQIEKGITKNASFARYTLPRIRQAPEVVPILVEDATEEGPYGAKGLGEITSIPTAPAITNAIYDAIGYRAYSLPARPERIMAYLGRGLRDRQ